MDYVTDTHSMVWYFTDDPRLSRRALEVFEKTIKEGAIITLAVVLAEIMYITGKGKITLTFDETLQKIDSYENFSVAALDLEILKVGEKIKLGENLRVTASFGLAQTLSGEVNVQALVGRADHALYRAKEEGGNCVRIADATVPQPAGDET